MLGAIAGDMIGSRFKVSGRKSVPESIIIFIEIEIFKKLCCSLKRNFYKTFPGPCINSKFFMSFGLLKFYCY